MRCASRFGRAHWLSVASIIAILAPATAQAANSNCNSIHAALIAKEGGISCTQNLPTPIPPTSVVAGGALAAPWDDDCNGKTPNACATYHYNHPERTVITNNTNNMVLIRPTTSAKCADGTKPVIYVGTGRDLSGDLPTSHGDGRNKWVFWFNGSSGKCSKSLNRATGTFTSLGVNCFNSLSAGLADSGFGQKTTKNLDGILSANCTDNPDFCAWNRVHIVGCSNDQYQGTSTTAPAVVHTKPNGNTLSAPAYSQGVQIVKDSMLHMTTLAGYNDFNSATTVMFSASSGGADGLIMTLDSMVAYADTLVTDINAQFFGFADARLEAGLDNAEAKFDSGGTAVCASIFKDDCPIDYDIPPAGTEDAGFLFNNSAFLPNIAGGNQGVTYETNIAWGAKIDESCEAAPGHGTNSPFCHDISHVAFNHLSTPIFFGATLVDINQANNPIEYLAESQPDTCWAGLGAIAGTGSALQEARTRAQAVAYAENRDIPNFGSHGLSHGAGAIGVWAAKYYGHEMARDGCLFNGVTVGPTGGQKTLMQALTSWLAGNSTILIDGYSSQTTFVPGAQACARGSYPCTCN